MTKILQINNISKKYKDFSLNNISFNLPKGYIMGLIGSNGSGKTTTIKAILDMINIDSGEIFVFGEKNNWKNKEFIGVVLDENPYNMDWTLEYIERINQIYYKNWDKEKFNSLIEYFSIKNQKIKEYSKGELQRIMLAEALSKNTKLLILDEPIDGLDPVIKRDFAGLIQDYLNNETSVLISSHLLGDLENILDYITHIENGNILFTGLKEDYINKYIVVKGSPDILNKDLRKNFIGCRRYTSGFEALIIREDLKKLDEDLIIEEPSLEDIIIYKKREEMENV